MMRKIKLTRANKIILLKALGDYYYQQRAVNTGWRETGYLILKVDSLPVGKKQFSPVRKSVLQETL